MSAPDLLARIVAMSDAGLARWSRWEAEIFRGLPPWARAISNAAIEVRVVIDVPDGVECSDALVITHTDTGVVERRLVQHRRILALGDSEGWVNREELGARTDTSAGRGLIAALVALERQGLAERSERVWWRPTAEGRKVANS